jgi:RNA polymerase sigma-70 factor (ECF subfamily)
MADTLSFEGVFRAHFDFVWRILHGMGVPAASVEDAAQDVFIVVLRRLPDFDGARPIRAWLFSIAMGVARNHRRTVRRKGAHHELEEALPDPGRSPAELAEARRSVARLFAILDTLHEDLRTVLVLTEIEQMTAAEIADLTGWKANTVSSRLRRARQAVEAALAREGERR